MSKTLVELAQDSLYVQNACNLSGVLIAAAQMIKDLRQLMVHAGTDEINNHPICRIWSDKIAHLTRTQSYGHENVMDAYEKVYQIIQRAKEIETGFASP